MMQFAKKARLPEPEQRKKDLAAMHAMQKKLGMDAAAAMALKLNKTGVASAADMNAAQRATYLAALRVAQRMMEGGKATAAHTATGTAPRAPRPAQARNPADAQDARFDKCRALWADLHCMGAVQDGSDAALASYINRQVKVSAWRFANTYQLNTVIESLKRWHTRVEHARLALAQRLAQGQAQGTAQQ